MSNPKNKPHSKNKNVTPVQNNPRKANTVQAGAKVNALPKDFIYYIGLGLVVILIFIIRKSFLTIPFERDEGSYAYAGRIILDGAIPFRDIGSQRLDGVFYAYALIVLLFGYSVKALHIGFLVLNICSTALLFFLTRKLSNSMTALAAAAIFALLSMTAAASGFTIQSEHLVAFLIISAFLCLVNYFDSRKMWLLLLSGLFLSFSFEIKQTSFFYALFAGALLLYKGIFVDKMNIKKLLLAVFLFGIAVIVPVLLDLFVIYKSGAWNDFNLWFFEIRNQYTSVISFDNGLEFLSHTFANIYRNYKFFWTISFLGTIVVFFTGLPLWKKILVAGLNIAGFLTIVPGYHYYGHYFLQWIPAVSLCAAFFLFSIQDLLINKMKIKAGTSVVAFILIVTVLFNLKSLGNYYFNPDHTRILRETYGINPFPESKVIADKLNTLMKPEDKLAVFGTEIQMYVYTNKKSPSRFAGSGALLEFPIKQSNDWQKEFMNDVEKAAPKYLVFFSHAISWMKNPKTENLIFPWFDKFSAEKYNLIGYADMGPNTNYVWAPDIDLVKNPPKSEYKILVFERK